MLKTAYGHAHFAEIAETAWAQIIETVQFNMADNNMILWLFFFFNLFMVAFYVYKIACNFFLIILGEFRRRQNILTCLILSRNAAIDRYHHAFNRRRTRRPRRFWIAPGRTSQWWQNMIGGVVGDQ